MRHILVALALLLPLPATAQDVDLELVLLADASGSIDEAEIRFQRQGYATAITDPRVLNAIRSTAYQEIAITYVEWASAGNEDVVVPWMRISDLATAQAFADALLPPPRRAFGRNAIGSALLKGKELIEGNDIDGWRKVIDFSGDSVNNYGGPPIAAARQEVLDAGITINALAINCRFCNGRPTSVDLEQAYADQIIGGPASFVVTAEDEAGFAEAVVRKLVLEISGRTPAPTLRRAGFQPADP